MHPSATQDTKTTTAHHHESHGAHGAGQQQAGGYTAVARRESDADAADSEAGGDLGEAGPPGGDSGGPLPVQATRARTYTVSVFGHGIA